MSWLRWASAIGIACCAALAGAAAPGTPPPAAAAKPAEAVALPKNPTHESIRELISHLSDPQARELLIAALDRDAVAAPAEKGAGAAPSKDGMMQMTGMAGMVAKKSGTLRERLHMLNGAMHALPATLNTVTATLANPDPGPPTGEEAGLGELALLVLGMLAVGFVAQRIYTGAMARTRAKLMRVPAASYFARVFQLCAGLAIDLGGLLVFVLGGLLVDVIVHHHRDLWRVSTLSILLAVAGVRMVALLARLLLRTNERGSRLLPLDRATAHTFANFLVVVSTLFAAGMVLLTLMTAVKASTDEIEVLRLGWMVVGVALSLWVVWRVRRPIAALIRGPGTPGAVRGWIAELWPVAATAYLLALFVGNVSNLIDATPGPIGVGFVSLVVVLVAPMVDLALCRALDALLGSESESATPDAQAPDATAAAHSQALAASTVAHAPVASPAAAIAHAPESTFEEDEPPQAIAAVPTVSPEVSRRRSLRAYAPIFRRAIHVIVVVVTLLEVAYLWDLPLFGVERSGLGAEITSALIGVGIAVLATRLAWEVTTTAIDNRLRAEGELKSDVPSTRLRTVLPILRATLLATIAVMAVMSILSALGVNILPLLAGASILGVAIGFGSQTLVKDIVSGAFFLMDDAFRLGEYIEVGDAKGRVEKINLRSVFLRHHRGALNVLPYGEIRRLRNTSRDWQVHVLEFRLSNDTNMLEVKKIMKKIGEDLAADPDYAGDIVAPLKSAGVMAAEESAIVVRAKFTARPTNNAWVVRRMAYDKIIRAFRESGITFANRQVTVLAAGANSAEVARSGAAAAALLERAGTDHG